MRMVIMMILMMLCDRRRDLLLTLGSVRYYPHQNGDYSCSDQFLPNFLAVWIKQVRPVRGKSRNPSISSRSAYWCMLKLQFVFYIRWFLTGKRRPNGPNRFRLRDRNQFWQQFIKRSVSFTCPWDLSECALQTLEFVHLSRYKTRRHPEQLAAGREQPVSSSK